MKLDLPQSPESEIWFDATCLDAAAADRYLAQLQQGIVWQQRSIRLFGKTLPQPRLVAWYGDPGASYSYSGLTWEPLAWTADLSRLKRQVEAAAGAMLERPLLFNSVLLNLYRDGQDSMGWHSDDEPELGHNPAIASLSLGAQRRFDLRHRRNKALKYQMVLTHGSLLVMAGATQHHWQHQIAKTKRVLQPRINLTFRYIQGG